MDGVDPHIWLSPTNVKKMAYKIGFIGKNKDFECERFIDSPKNEPLKHEVKNISETFAFNCF